MHFDAFLQVFRCVYVYVLYKQDATLYIDYFVWRET